MASLSYRVRHARGPEALAVLKALRHPKSGFSGNCLAAVSQRCRSVLDGGGKAGSSPSVGMTKLWNWNQRPDRTGPHGPFGSAQGRLARAPVPTRAGETQRVKSWPSAKHPSFALLQRVGISNCAPFRLFSWIFLQRDGVALLTCMTRRVGHAQGSEALLRA